MMISGITEPVLPDFPARLLPGTVVRVEALAHFPIERDLVIGMEGFIEKPRASSPTSSRRKRPLAQGEYLQTPAQLNAYEQFSSCINCMLCYAACPQFGLNPDFVGPAALALLHPIQHRLGVTVARPNAWNWSTPKRRVQLHGRRILLEVCPKHVDPANAVNQNKTNSAMDYFLRFVLAPEGGAVVNKASSLRPLNGRIGGGKILFSSNTHDPWGTAPSSLPTPRRSC